MAHGEVDWRAAIDQQVCICVKYVYISVLIYVFNVFFIVYFYILLYPEFFLHLSFLIFLI